MDEITLQFIAECVARARDTRHPMPYQRVVVALAEEIEVLRLYGNKDCTAMADAELSRRRANSASPVTTEKP